MPLPTFDAFCRPALEVLAEVNGPVRTRDLFQRVAERVGLSAEDRALRVSSGQLTFENRVGWACTWMKHADFVVNSTKGIWQVTEAGRSRLKNPKPITAAELRPFADPRVREPGAERTPTHPVADAQAVPNQTPDERIDGAVEDIKRELAAELQDRLKRSPPEFFERTVLTLLKVMGYASELGRAEHAGRTGDGGIDGILYLDRLGLERVYVQAKRWDGGVGAPTIRDFAGAMDVLGATKGVILTTSRYSADAKAYVERSPKRIRLVDGVELTSLMIEFAVGVSHERTIVLPRLDRDFFEEDL